MPGKSDVKALIVCMIIGRPARSRNCFGTSEFMRVPVPPPTMMTEFPGMVNKERTLK